MQKVSLIVLCSLLLCMPALVRADGGGGNESTSNTPEARMSYEKAYGYLKAGQYREAIQAFQQVLEAEPKNAMAYNNLAYSYRKLGKYKRAIKLYETALDIDPNLAEAHEYMGEALLALGRVDEAEKHLAILERLNPQLAEELRGEIARHKRS